MKILQISTIDKEPLFFTHYSWQRAYILCYPPRL